MKNNNNNILEGNEMGISSYMVEFNGSDYVVYLGARAVGSFASIDEAFEAKRSFEQRATSSIFDKTPPAMRAAKQRLYQQF